MPAEIRRFHWHYDDVADPGADLVVAAGAQVFLARLVGLYPKDLERPETLRHLSRGGPRPEEE